MGLLGQDLFGSDFDFRLKIKEGAELLYVEKKLP